MTSSGARPAARVVAAVAAGAAVGWLQEGVDRIGMRQAAAHPDLSGIGVAAEWVALFLLVSLMLVLIACRVLALRSWFLAAMALIGAELVVVGVGWNRAPAVGLYGDDRAVLFVPAAVVVLTAAAVWWPRRSSGSVERQMTS